MENQANFAETAVSVLVSKFGGKREEKAKWDACIVIPQEYLHNAIEFLKDDPAFKMDIRYQQYGHTDKRHQHYPMF